MVEVSKKEEIHVLITRAEIKEIVLTPSSINVRMCLMVGDRPLATTIISSIYSADDFKHLSINDGLQELSEEIFKEVKKCANISFENVQKAIEAPQEYDYE